jgi:transmembrane secretion effector
MLSGDRAAITSAWSPLRQPLFRALWLAAVTSNIGTWMQSTGAVWLMTSLTPSPLMVALVQTATSLPFFLLALPAGALADVVDRRRLLLGTPGWMLTAAALLGLLTLVGTTTPWTLLALTFLLGLGTAVNTPAWQAIIPDLVPRPELPAAVALGGVAVSLARAVGPALGGLLVGLTVITRYRLGIGEALDLTPSKHWPEPAVVIAPQPEEGPVLVLVEYRIDPRRAHEFALAMRDVRLERLRDGASHWGLFRDPANPVRYVEAFTVASWVEHLRQHERVTMADRAAEARAYAFHIGETPLVISHLVAEHLPT